MADGNVYCDATDVRDWLNVDDNGLDWIFDPEAASRWVDGHCGRRFWLDEEPVARYFDVSRDGTVWTDDFTVDDDFELATDSGNGSFSSVWSSSDFQALPLNAPYGAEPSPYWQIASTGGSYGFSCYGQRRGNVRVTARWGWPEVPAAVKRATIMQCARLAKRRTSPEGVAGFSDFGAVRVSNVDRDVEALLAPYVLIGVA